jgi:hypothetical protein
MTTSIEKQIVSDWNSNNQTQITEYLKKMGLSGKAEHIGLKQYSPTPEWAVYKKQKSFAKTDIKIGDYKISLKTANDHILMSAKKDEATATLMMVAELIYGNMIPDLIYDAVMKMKDMVTSAVSPVTITKAKKSGTPIIKDAEQKHKYILQEILKTFNDKKFKTAFIQEVLTGRMKFGENSDGCATHILYITHKPILHPLTNTSFISDMANTIDIRVDFKSTRKIQGSEIGQYRYWSILQMISKEFIRDSVIYEDSYMTKPMSYLISILATVKKFINNWSDLFDFLEVEPTVTIKEK